MGSIKLLLREDQQRADGTAPIYLRIIQQRRTRFVATGLRVEPRFWDARRQQVRRSHPLAAVMNRKLQNLKLQAEAALIETGTADAAKRLLKGAGGRPLLELGQQHARALLEEGRYWAHVQQKTMLAKLEAFRTDARLQDLSPGFVEEFRRFLEVKVGNAPATVRKALQALHRLARHCIRQGLIEHDPFLQVTMPSEPVPYRRRLSLEEIEALARVDLPPPPSPLARARDAFLLSLYGAGVRFGDVCRLTTECVRTVEGRPWLHYRMAKTGKHVEVPLPDRALEIIARWEGPWRPLIFPFLRPGDTGDPVRERRRIASMNASTNEALKKLAAMAGLERPEELSMHVARHTFADLARRAGSLYVVSRLLGHANLKVTERYLAGFDREAAADLSRRLWEER